MRAEAAWILFFLDCAGVLQRLPLIFLLVAAISCRQNDAQSDKHVSSDSLEGRIYTEDEERCIFKNVTEVVKNQNVCSWYANPEFGSGFLSFGDGNSGTLFFGSEPIEGLETDDFSLKLPFKNDSAKITVFWNLTIAGKCSEKLTARLDSLNDKYINRPFMTLELGKENTLKATYILPELINELHKTPVCSRFFSRQYTAGYIEM